MKTKTSFYQLFIPILILVFSLISCSGTPGEKSSLVVYCGAGLNKAATEIGATFEKQTGISIQFNFGGSNILLSQLQLVKNGDIYIPGSSYYLEIAKSKGLIDQSHPITYHIPVIAVTAGNPKNITCLKDLTNPGVRVALGDPDAAAIGRASVQILKKNNLMEAVSKQVVTRTATVNELVVFLSLGQVDAIIVWEDNILTVKEKLEIVSIPETQNGIKTIPAGILTFSKQKKLAQQFFNYLQTAEAGKIFRKYGFKPHSSLIK